MGLLQVDDAVFEDCRREVETDAELLELDRYHPVFGSNRERELTTCEETRRVTRQGRQVGFGKPACHALLLHCLKKRVDLHAVVEQPGEHLAEWQRAGNQRIDDAAADTAAVYQQVAAS